MYFIKKYKRGIFNKYYRGMPVGDMIIKDLKHFARLIILFFSSGFRVKTVFVHPHYPSKKSTVVKVFRRLGFNYTNKPYKKFEFALHWDYSTIRTEYEILDKIAEKKQVINLKTRNISKNYVDKIFGEVFGYKTEIDPFTHVGKCVEKSNINALHNYKIIDCPISTPKENTIYQIVINNETSDKLVIDHRVAIVGLEIPYVYIKYRSVEVRFQNTEVKTELKTAKDVFSDWEIEKIMEFAKKMNLDYAEIDVLRCRDTQKIYIIDVNNSPHGPHKNLSQRDAEIAMSRLAEAFKWEFLER